MNLTPQCSQKVLFGTEWIGAGRLTLEINGKVIPSFKNNKMLIVKDPRGRPLRKPLLITRPDLQKQMAEITNSFVSQLSSAFRTTEGEILMGCFLRYAIASSVPDDDCLTRIREIHIQAEMCERGSEGATLTIESL